MSRWTARPAPRRACVVRGFASCSPLSLPRVLCPHLSLSCFRPWFCWEHTQAVVKGWVREGGAPDACVLELDFVLPRQCLTGLWGRCPPGPEQERSRPV